MGKVILNNYPEDTSVRYMLRDNETIINVHLHTINDKYEHVIEYPPFTQEKNIVTTLIPANKQFLQIDFEIRKADEE